MVIERRLLGDMGPAFESHVVEMRGCTTAAELDRHVYPDVLRHPPAASVHQVPGQPLIALTIIHNIGVRLRLDADSIENLGTYDAALRLGKVLLRLAAQFGEGPPDKTHLHVRFTHRDMVDIAAMSRQTVTTQLGHLRRIGLVSRKGPYLVVNVRHLSDYLYARSLQQDEGDTATDRQGATLR